MSCRAEGTDGRAMAEGMVAMMAKRVVARFMIAEGVGLDEVEMRSDCTSLRMNL